MLVVERGGCERSSPAGHGWRAEWAWKEAFKRCATFEIGRIAKNPTGSRTFGALARSSHPQTERRAVQCPSAVRHRRHHWRSTLARLQNASISSTLLSVGQRYALLAPNNIRVHPRCQPGFPLSEARAPVAHALRPQLDSSPMHRNANSSFRGIATTSSTLPHLRISAASLRAAPRLPLSQAERHSLKRLPIARSATFGEHASLSFLRPSRREHDWSRRFPDGRDGRADAPASLPSGFRSETRRPDRGGQSGGLIEIRLSQSPRLARGASPLWRGLPRRRRQSFHGSTGLSESRRSAARPEARRPELPQI